ncbi:MAG: hypothetical protein WC732_07430 [Candidatus Omnitrophota bacterium]
MKNKRTTGFLCGLLILLTVCAAFAQAPGLPLEKAIEIAQKALTATTVPMENYYLFSVILTNSSKGQYWYHTYRAIRPSEYNEIFAKVFMDGSLELSGGPFAG